MTKLIKEEGATGRLHSVFLRHFPAGAGQAEVNQG